MVNTQNLKLVAIGNPLLDMQIRNGEEVLQKYGLKANDAVLASPEQQSIYKYIVDNYEVTYIAGGAAQNTARAAQYVLPEGSTAYIGCVGNDDLAQQLRNANDREGLQSVYQVTDAAATGSCAVVITGHDRSLCTNLGAAEKFDKRHLDSPDAKAAIDAAQFFYIGGFFLTHGVEIGRDRQEGQGDPPPRRAQPVGAVHPAVLQEPGRPGDPLRQPRYRQRVRG